MDVVGRPCLVVGGGPVAARKVATLVEAGALVTVVAPDVVEAIASPTPGAGPMTDQAAGTVTIDRRRYRAGDAAGYDAGGDGHRRWRGR